LTAEDVVFTFNRLLDPDVASPARSGFQAIEQVVALDDLTVRFDLKEGNAFFPDNLALYQAKVIASDIDPDRLANEIFGTGAFKLVEYSPGQRAVFERHDDYPLGENLPYLDGFIFFFIPEVEPRIQALLDGAVDMINPLPPSAVPRLEGNPDIVIDEAVSASYLTIALDNRKPPWDNQLVRKAFQHAIDRQGIVDAALFGQGSVGYDTPFPNSSPYFNEALELPAYDPERSLELLRQAGYADGVDLTLYTAPAVPGMVELAVAVREMAAPAGFRVDVQRTPADTYWGSTWMNQDVFVSFWGDRPPDLALNVAWRTDAPWNESWQANADVDRLMDQAAATKDFDERKQLYGELQRILQEDATRIVPAFVSNLIAYRSDVHGVQAHPSGRLRLEEAWLDK
jgi:peptide/nickel transport system substrate-binding protein